MPQQPSTADRESDAADRSSRTPRLARQTALTVLVVSLVAVQPAAAQTNAVCTAESLPEMIEGFFQLTTALGIIGLAIVWQADSLIEMFTLQRDQKEGLKRHKRSAMKSAVVLVVLGPLYTVAGSMMGLPLADCVNLVPW